MRRYVVAVCTLLFASSVLQAQGLSTRACTEGENKQWWGGSEGACEVRYGTLPLERGGLKVRGLNGSIEVVGEDRQDVALEAHVTAKAWSQSEAAAILREVTIATSGTIEASGPKSSWDGHKNWSVSYRLRVPHRLAARLETTNGSLALSALDGDIHAETTNGSVRFSELAGDVHVSTTNGSVKADLGGSTWRGTGLFAGTTNGSVAVTIAQPYAAHLVASTTNGSVATAFGTPIGRRSRDLDTQLGAGGPTVRFETTNGSVAIR